MSSHKRLPDPEDSWAQVELYRWQHGHLPGEPGEKERSLSVPAGLRGMADAIEKRDTSNFPSPFNVMSVLRYAAKLIEGHSAADTSKPESARTGTRVPARPPAGVPVLARQFAEFDYLGTGPMRGNPQCGELAVWKSGWRAGWQIPRRYEPARGLHKAILRGSSLHRANFAPAGGKDGEA